MCLENVTSQLHLTHVWGEVIIDILLILRQSNVMAFSRYEINSQSQIRVISLASYSSTSRLVELFIIRTLHIPDPIYNWLVEFFADRKHCTRFQGITSQILDITGSIIQGSAVGPMSYVISALDLSTVTTGNSMHKYADDTYLVIPARNAHSREAELYHVADWA